MLPAVPTISNVVTSATHVTVRWTISKVVYTPETYTVYYSPQSNCPFSASNLEDFHSSITTYTPNNHTLTDFFFEESMKFSVNIGGLTPSTTYCCFVVATNSYGSTSSEHFSFETEINGKKYMHLFKEGSLVDNSTTPI